jgi:hypothetical protein
MQKALTDFLFGLCFGMGFLVAYGVCKLIASLFANAGFPGL